MSISSSDFSNAMRGFSPGEPPSIAIAVSGGGDSMALALLMHAWAKEHGGTIIALTVDHALRDGSRAEAEETGRRLAALGIAHEILTWMGDKPCTGIQQHARAARYALLAEACRKHGCNTLALAHNLEDQAETFWMRLAHGSGLDGLAGMAAQREEGGIMLIRPVLGFTRAELRATCAARNVAWAEDPSNENEKFLRVRLRQFEDVLAAEGLTPARLAATLQKLKTAREALEFFAARTFDACVVLKDGRATLDLPAWKEQPQDIQSRVLSRALQSVVPQEYPAGAEGLERLRAALLSPGFTGRTLAGCEIYPEKGRVIIARENAQDAA